MKNRWLFISIFGIFILSSCGTSGYYSSTFSGDPIYTKRTMAERKAAIEKQKALAYKDKENEDYKSEEFDLLEGESYEQRLNRFDGSIVYVPFYDRSWSSWHYRYWGRPWYDYSWMRYGAAAYVGWWGYSHWHPLYGWYDPWYYDWWHHHHLYSPGFYPEHHHPGAGPAKNNIAYAKRTYDTGGPRSTTVVNTRRSSSGNVGSGRRSSSSSASRSTGSRSTSTNVRNSGYSSSSRSSSSSYSNSSSRSSSSYSGGSSSSRSGGNSGGGYTGGGSHSGGGRR